MTKQKQFFPNLIHGYKLRRNSQCDFRTRMSLFITQHAL